MPNPTPARRADGLCERCGLPVFRRPGSRGPLPGIHDTCRTRVEAALHARRARQKQRYLQRLRERRSA